MSIQLSDRESQVFQKQREKSQNQQSPLKNYSYYRVQKKYNEPTSEYSHSKSTQKERPDKSIQEENQFNDIQQHLVQNGNFYKANSKQNNYLKIKVNKSFKNKKFNHVRKHSDLKTENSVQKPQDDNQQHYFTKGSSILPSQINENKFINLQNQTELIQKQTNSELLSPQKPKRYTLSSLDLKQNSTQYNFKNNNTSLEKSINQKRAVTPKKVLAQSIVKQQQNQQQQQNQNGFNKKEEQTLVNAFNKYIEKQQKQQKKFHYINKNYQIQQNSNKIRKGINNNQQLHKNASTESFCDYQQNQLRKQQALQNSQVEMKNSQAIVEKQNYTDRILMMGQEFQNKEPKKQNINSKQNQKDPQNQLKSICSVYNQTNDDSFEQDSDYNFIQSQQKQSQQKDTSFEHSCTYPLKQQTHLVTSPDIIISNNINTNQQQQKSSNQRMHLDQIYQKSATNLPNQEFYSRDNINQESKTSSSINCHFARRNNRNNTNNRFYSQDSLCKLDDNDSSYIKKQRILISYKKKNLGNQNHTSPINKQIQKIKLDNSTQNQNSLQSTQENQTFLEPKQNNEISTQTNLYFNKEDRFPFEEKLNSPVKQSQKQQQQQQQQSYTRQNLQTETETGYFNNYVRHYSLDTLVKSQYSAMNQQSSSHQFDNAFLSGILQYRHGDEFQLVKPQQNSKKTQKSSIYLEQQLSQQIQKQIFRIQNHFMQQKIHDNQKQSKISMQYKYIKEQQQQIESRPTDIDQESLNLTKPAQQQQQQMYARPKSSNKKNMVNVIQTPQKKPSFLQQNFQKFIKRHQQQINMANQTLTNKLTQY